MKNKSLIIAIITVGAIITIGFGTKFMGFGAEKNVPEVIQEGKKLAKAKDVETFVDHAFTMYKKHSPISNDVWDGYDLKEKVVIVGELDNKTNEVLKAWKFTETDKIELTNEQIREIEFPSAGGYSEIKFENKEGIVMAANKQLVTMFSFLNFNYIYEVAVHEMYHFYGDDMEKYTQQNQAIDSQERFTKFPQDVMPRVYRKMIYDNLVLAYESSTDKNMYLGRAKYWNEKWKTEYPQEYKQIFITDIAEGKARYIEYLMCIDYDGISETEKISAIKHLFDKETTVFDGLDSESYELGFVSGVLLDQHNPDWKKEITDNPQPPVEMILEDAVVIKDNSDNFDKVLKSATAQINKTNKQTQKKMKHIEEAENNNNIPLLKLSSDFMSGSFSISDFIEYKGKIIYLDFGATFKSNNGIVTIDGLSTYLLGGEDQNHMLPLTMTYKFENNRLIIDGKGIKADIQVKETQNSEGRTIYMME